MTSLGMWSCQWRELRPITFGDPGQGKRQIPHDGPDAAAEDTGTGHGRGRGRARGRDGNGEYEMIAMTEGADINV